MWIILDILVLGLEISWKYHLFLNINSDCYSRIKRITLLMSCISMSNVEILIYVLVSSVFHNVQFLHFDDLKMRLILILHRVLLSQWIWIICVGIRNIWKYPFFLNVNSDCYISNTRIAHLISCISISNEDNLVNVLISWVFQNVYFRHFDDLKMRFLLLPKRGLLSHWFW
jgi:hypothetical protein